MKWSLYHAGAAALLWQTALGQLAQRTECNCATAYVTHLVIEMPSSTASASVSATEAATVKVVEALAATSSVSSLSATTTSSASATATATLGPIANPEVDTSNLDNVIPVSNVSLWYGSNDASTAGTINMTLALNHSTVALEYIDSISSVSCGDDELSVSFNSSAAFEAALSAWSAESTLIMITNHLGNCDAEFERGFFKVSSISSTASTNTIKCASSKEELVSISKSCEMTFNSVPAATLGKRITLDESTSLSFSETINKTTIYSYEDYIDITLDSAKFDATVTFSGYLYYNFWGFKLEELYFDIDTTASASVGLSVEVGAAYSTSYTYAPSDLTYTLVSVPGVLELGPGVAFSIELDLAASGAVDVTADFGVSLADGNVHIDLLDSSNTAAKGWTPTYADTVDISEKATVQADVIPKVTVEIAIKVLGGLIDLSSGLTAIPRFNNNFTLSGLQVVNGTTVSVDSDSSSCTNGVYLDSEFVFELDGFATQWFSTELYSVTVPIVDKCYTFSK